MIILGISGVASSRVQTLLSRSYALRDSQASLMKSGMWCKGWAPLLLSSEKRGNFSQLSLTIVQVKVSKMNHWCVRNVGAKWPFM